VKNEELAIIGGKPLVKKIWPPDARAIAWKLGNSLYKVRKKVSWRQASLENARGRCLGHARHPIRLSILK